MKIDITFKDLSESEANKLFAKLSEPAAQLDLPFENNVKVTQEEIQTIFGKDVKEDARGFPWDERIHAQSKRLNKDGTWKKKKGVSDEETARVEAELQNKIAAASALPTPQAEQPVTIPNFLQPKADNTPAPQADAPTTPAPTTPAPQADAPASSARNFVNLMTLIGQLNGSGKTDSGYVHTIVSRTAQAFNTQLTTITDIMQQPQMIEYAFSLIENDGFSA